MQQGASLMILSAFAFSVMTVLVKLVGEEPDVWTLVGGGLVVSSSLWVARGRA